MQWYNLSVTFRWPHEGVLLGFEIINPTTDDPFNTIRLHFIFFSINFDFTGI